MAASPLFPPQKSLELVHLHWDITEMDLHFFFSSVAPISSIRIYRCSLTGESLGYACVNFFTEDAARRALQILNHTWLKGKHITLRWPWRKTGTLFLAHLDASINSITLKNIFRRFGTILSCKVGEKHGKSNGCGIVQFDSEFSAHDALTALSTLHEDIWIALKFEFVMENERTKATRKASILFVKHLENCVDETVLREIFSPWGNIVSAKVMRHDDGASKGFGFVCFSNPEEARSAQINLHRYTYGKKRLHVAIAQTNRERELELQKSFAQSQPQSPCFPPLPYFNNPNFGANMRYNYSAFAQSLFPNYPTAVKWLKDRDINNLLYRHPPLASVMTGNVDLMAESFLNSNNSSNSIYQNLQPDHEGSSDGAAQVVTEANSKKRSSSEELA